ncbi:MAG: carbohydrate-binding protein [Opitutaceae bacterium]
MNTLTKSIFAILSLLCVRHATADVAYVFCDEFYSDSFTYQDTTVGVGLTEPYYECTWKEPTYIEARELESNNCAEAWWTETPYDANPVRTRRGVEACSGNSTTELRFKEDGWYGLRIRIPSGTFPTDKNTIVLQMFAHGRGGSWAGTLIINDNRLSIEHRHWLTTNTTVYELDADIERDTWIPIIIHFKPSTNPAIGKMQVWYDGAPKHDPSYDFTGTFAYDGIDTTGDGQYDDDGWVDEDTMKSGIGLKWGMYCADVANYTADETRTLYYDDVAQLKGNPVGAWELVNPEADGRDAFSRVDAEYYSDQSGVVTSACTDTDGGFQLDDIQDGDWVALYDVNFGTGADAFRARVASNIAGGSIEVRLGSPTGTLIATCPVGDTGGTDSWLTKTVAMTTTSGLHHVYLVFTGGAGNLLSLNWFSAVKSTPDEFFSNDLIDGGLVARDFHENLPSGGNGIWSYTNDYALAQDGSSNTELQGGAVVSYVTTDNDSARSYLATDFSNYADKSWTARVAVETVNTGSKNTIFFGLGTGVQNGANNEPANGDHVFVHWESGTSGSKVSVDRNGTEVVNTGSWQGDPGYDIYMTYNAIDKTIFFEIDNWNGGRFSGVNVTTATVSTDGFLNDTNNMNIFFGGNGTMTFGDFEVYEPNPPMTPSGLNTAMFTPLEVTLDWDAVADADAYSIYRSTGSGSGYMSIATDVVATTYVDTTVVAGQAYDYAISSTNAYGESPQSASARMVAVPYVIIGPDSSYPASNPVSEKDNLFDGDVDTFYDTTVNNSWVGLDFGSGNAQQLVGASYTLRDWSVAADRTIGAVIQGANAADFTGATTLYTVPAEVLEWDTANEVIITDTNTYRYVRMLAQSGRPLYGLSELSFSTTNPGPTGLTAGSSSGQIVLDWNAVNNATAYTVQRATTSGGPYTAVGTPTGISYTDSTALTGTYYHYVVSATVNSSESDLSAEVTSIIGSAPAKFTVTSGDITASTFQAGNVPANTIDGNTGTRWSAQGDPQWIRYDLGSVMNVHSLEIAWLDGDTRWSSFHIEVSDDDTNWTAITANQQSSGTTTALETVDVPDTFARYVRIVGHGNQSNAWNSITEVEIWGAIPSPAELWRNNYFGDPVNTGDGADMANSDTDTLVNLLEFAFGTDPTANDAGALTVNEVGGTFTPGTPVVDIEFNPLSVKARFIRRVDHASSGITYTAQFSNELSTWEDLDGSTAVQIIGVPESNGYEAVELSYPTFLSTGRKARFYRVKIDDTPSGNTNP